MVSTKISKTSWTKIIQEILRDYDTVDFWESDRILSRVWILKRTDLGKSAPKNQAERLMDSYQLMIRIPPGMKMPPRIYENPEIRPFLQMHGIHHPDAWKDIHLAGVARRQAERNLNALQYVERQKKNKLGEKNEKIAKSDENNQGEIK